MEQLHGHAGGRGAGLRVVRGILAVLCASSIAVLWPTLAAGDTIPTVKHVERFKQMVAAAGRNDCKSAISLGQPILDETFGLVDEARALAFDIVTSCELNAGAFDRAYVHALQGTPLEHSSDGLWQQRLGLELDNKRYEAATVTIEQMSQGRGAALNAVPPNWMSSFLRQLTEAHRTDLRLRTLKVLSADAYQPDESTGSTDDYRYSLASLLAEKGDTEDARQLLARVRDPWALAHASVDPRLRSLLPASIDFRAAAEATLAKQKEAIALHPDRLDPLINAALALRQLSRPQEALDLLQTAASRIDDPAAFTDRDAKLNWWWDSLARTYVMLGKYDEAAAAFTKGGAIAEIGTLNVSQVINLADTQIQFGRGEAALGTLAVFADPKRKGSPFGEMEMRLARACAHVVAGHPAGAQDDLAYAKAHEKDDPRALGDLLLCLEDADGAAAVMIRRLDDSDQRIEALLQLSDYDDPPVAISPDPIGTRLKALKQRPDIRAAVERAGGTRRISLQKDEI